MHINVYGKFLLRDLQKQNFDTKVLWDALSSAQHNLEVAIRWEDENLIQMAKDMIDGYCDAIMFLMEGC